MSFFISRIVSTPFFTKITRNFATKMQASSTSKTKDSAGRRLGVKKFGGEEVFPNDIIIRQRGFKWKPGKNTASGLDHTIHSRVEVKSRYFKGENIFGNWKTINVDGFFIKNYRGKTNLRSNTKKKGK